MIWEHRLLDRFAQQVRLNHKTHLFRVTYGRKTLGRFEEVETQVRDGRKILVCSNFDVKTGRRRVELEVIKGPAAP